MPKLADSTCGAGAPWFGNTLGQDHQRGIVPPPWNSSPIATTNGTTSKVILWGREYSFGGATALPTQIRSQGTDLLFGPIALNVVMPGGIPLTWNPPQNVSLIQSNAVAAHVSRSGTASHIGSSVTLTSNATVEYDGFVWLDVALGGIRAGTLVDVTLEISLAHGIAEYTHRPLSAPPVILADDPWFGTRKSYSGNAAWRSTPNGLSDWVGGFIPYWWLGNNDVGLSWFIEDHHAWPNWCGADTTNNVYPIELQYYLPNAVQRLRLLRQHPIPPNWKFEFGLQATPVKLLVEGSQPRRWRGRSTRIDSYNDPVPGMGTTRVVEVGGQHSSLGEERGWTTAFGYPELKPSNAADYAGVKYATHQVGGRLVQYALLTELSDASPEWPACGQEWSGGDCFSSGLPDKSMLCITNPASSFADFIVWKSNAFMTSPGVDGFYHDQTVLYDVALTDPTVGPSTYPIRAYRDLYRRIYTQAKKGPPRFLFANMSGEMNISVLAYEDGHLDGEQLLLRLSGSPDHLWPDRIDRYVTGQGAVLTLDEFRAEFMGRQWGLVPFFYPKSDSTGTPAGAASTDELLALLMLHDVGLFGDFADGASVAYAYETLDAFNGFVDAQFIPYFKSPAPVHASTPSVYGSVYRNAQGHGLVVMANFNDGDKYVQIAFDAGYFPSISRVECLTPRPPPRHRPVTVVPNKDVYSVELPGHGGGPPGSYKLLHVYP